MEKMAAASVADLVRMAERLGRRRRAYRRALPYQGLFPARARILALRSTLRERDVFTLVAAGLMNKHVADRLGIAEKTVKIHRGRVMEKLAAGSVADLVRMAERLGKQRAAAPD